MGSSLVELKKELEAVELERVSKVTKMVELEVQLEDQKKFVDIITKHKLKLQRAVDILEDRIPTMAESAKTEPGYPALAEPPPPPPPAPKYQGPKCQACGDPAYRAIRTVPSGAMVEYWQCSNGSCNSEQY